MEGVPRDFVATARQHVAPDPGVLRAIGLNHSLQSAVADLVDNSLDAGAEHVLVRFVQRHGKVERIIVVDDGRGMDQAAVDDAMQLGRRQDAADRRLGHFGVGLKAASFSQAGVLTVLSRRDGAPAQGRRMRRDQQGFEVEVLSYAASSAALDTRWGPFRSFTGTAVVWDDLHNVPSSPDPAVTQAYLDEAVGNVRRHLGLVLHRLLADDRLKVWLDVLDEESGATGLLFAVAPLDPFDYPRAGAAGYPKTLRAESSAGGLVLLAHIWPANNDSTSFRLLDGPDRAQGLYLYRNGRLLQRGGWSGLLRENKRYRLARIAIDIEQHLTLFKMGMEKDAVQLTADAAAAVHAAVADDGTTFNMYLDAAAEAFREGNRRETKLPAMLAPGQGVVPRVKKAVAREAQMLDDEPVRIRWRALDDDSLVEVDRGAQTLWLNNRYRSVLLNGKPAGVNDVPLLKTLLYLLYEDVFRGAALGPKDKLFIQLWNEVLTAAARSELLDRRDD